MQTSTKLTVLNATATLLGWIAIISGIASVYFLVVALAFHGHWSNLFWALGTTIIATWLSKGFADNRKRIAFEAECMRRGLTPREAGAAWINAYGRGSRLHVPTPPDHDASPKQALHNTQELIDRYNEVLGRDGPAVRPETDLPARKEHIKNAILTLARHAKTSGGSPERLGLLRTAYMLLANFVSEADAKAAKSFDELMRPGHTQLDDADLRKLATRATHAGMDAIAVQRRCNDEFTRLGNEFDVLVGE